MMQTTDLLIAFMLLVAFLLSGCSAKEVPVSVVTDGAQAGDLNGSNDCELQPPDSKTEYATE
jgi:hypothetical protein